MLSVLLVYAFVYSLLQKNGVFVRSGDMNLCSRSNLKSSFAAFDDSSHIDSVWFVGICLSCPDV